MKKHRVSAVKAKATEAERMLLNERLDNEARVASEKIRLRFDNERKALERRYGVVTAQLERTEKM